MSIKSFLEENERKELLRFSTAGSVDDGKSTLIGRLLNDSKSIYDDHLSAIKAQTGSADGEVDWALLTDGLKAEREQGITIDVAYRYFSTPKRKFIIADTPGHEQYTRNMVTGASTADLAIILIDARKGVLTQSKRHSFISALLQIPHLVIAVNKMDLVDYSQARFEEIREEFSNFAAKLNVHDMRFIPISALKGDNVVDHGDKMPWYQGEPLLGILENVHIASDRNFVDLRFPVQYVSRPNQDFRGFSGQLASGVLTAGKEVMVLPSRKRSKIKSIVTFDGDLEEAYPPMSVTVTLEDEIDVSRGDMLVYPKNLPRSGRHFEAMLVWMDETPLDKKGNYYIKHTTQHTKAIVEKLSYRVDVNNLTSHEAESLGLNEIGRVVFTTYKPLHYDAYDRNRQTGSFILVDAESNLTVGAGMIIHRRPVDELPTSIVSEEGDVISQRGPKTGVDLAERERRLGQRSAGVWFTGLVSSGKSDVAYALERRLFDDGYHSKVLDGGSLRRALNRELAFSNMDIAENLRRAAEASRLLNDAGLITLCSFVSPYRGLRDSVREIVGEERYVEIFVDAPVTWAEQRDETGLYARARNGEIRNLAGVTSTYEAPEAPNIRLRPDEQTLEEMVDEIMAYLRDNEFIDLKS